MAFKFGADPEFLLINERKRQVPANAHTGTGTLLPDSRTAIIGCNGHPSTAEMRPRPVDTSDLLDEQCQNLVKRCYTEYIQPVNPRVLSSERILLYFSPGGMDDSGRNEPCGGHIHLTSDDRMWWKSYQARVTIPFWNSVICFLTDKSQKVRQQSFSYGRFMQLGRSPDQGAWSDTWIGWEYRTPGTWLAPKNKKFRDVLFKGINSLLSQDADAQRKQKEFCDAFFGYDVAARHNVNNAYNYPGRIQCMDEQLERNFITNPNAMVTKLKELARTQDYHEMDWFLDMLNVNDSYPLDWNPPGVYPTTKPKPAKAQFTNMAKAIEAVTGIADEAIASGKFTRYYKTGKTECERLRVLWKQESVPDPLRGVDVVVVRDMFVPELSYHAMGLAKDAVLKKVKNERGEGRKFDNPAVDDIHVVGSVDTRGDAETVVFTREPWFANNRDIRSLLATEHLKIMPWDVGNGTIGMKWSFRESEGKMVFVILALYFLWRLNYIAEGGGGSTPTGLGALFS